MPNPVVLACAEIETVVWTVRTRQQSDAQNRCFCICPDLVSNVVEQNHHAVANLLSEFFLNVWRVAERLHVQRKKVRAPRSCLQTKCWNLKPIHWFGRLFGCTTCLMGPGSLRLGTVLVWRLVRLLRPRTATPACLSV